MKDFGHINEPSLWCCCPPLSVSAKSNLVLLFFLSSILSIWLCVWCLLKLFIFLLHHLFSLAGEQAAAAGCEGTFPGFSQRRNSDCGGWSILQRSEKLLWGKRLSAVFSLEVISLYNREHMWDKQPCRLTFPSAAVREQLWADCSKFPHFTLPLSVLMLVFICHSILPHLRPPSTHTLKNVSFGIRSGSYLPHAAHLFNF